MRAARGGATLIDLGAGNDQFLADTDSNSALAGITYFGQAVTLLGGAGDDVFDLAVSGGQHVNFGGPVYIWGGSGSDTSKNYSGNVFYFSIAHNDCEQKF